MTNVTDVKKTLVLGGTGKTGRRLVERLAARGMPTRVGSRLGRAPFVWEDRSTWAPVLEGVGSAYVSYYPDLAVPGAPDTVGSFAELAARSGVRRLVLLAGRGGPEAEEAEDAVRASGAELTIVRSTWFAQNFSEDYIVEGVRSGEVALPARRARAVRRRRRHRRRRRRSADRRPPHRGGLRADRAAAPHVRPSVGRDLRGDRPGDPLRAGLDRRLRGRRVSGLAR